jgi:hypothetical protein
LLLIYPAIVAVTVLCFQVEYIAYLAFLNDGDGFSLLPVILIAVVSLVPFITVKPFYKAYTSLFNKISSRVGDVQTRVSTANQPKTADNKRGNWLTNTQQRLKAALTNQSNTTSRQHSIKERLERETLEKNKPGSDKSTRAGGESGSSTSVRNNIVNSEQGAEITNAINNKTENITRARSERTQTQNSFLNNSTNRTSNNSNLRPTSSLPNSPNQRLEQSRRNEANPALTLDRMGSRLKLDVDRTGSGTSSIVPNNTVNNFRAQQKTLDKNQIAPDISRRKAAEGEKKQPLAATLNAPKFADTSKAATQPQKDQIEANLSEKAERILTQNKGVTTDKTKGTDKETGEQITRTLDTSTKDAKDTGNNATPGIIETAMNGGAVTADAKVDPKLDDGADDVPLAPSILPPVAEPPSAAKNVKKALKNIFS